MSLFMEITEVLFEIARISDKAAEDKTPKGVKVSVAIDAARGELEEAWRQLKGDL